MLMSLGSDVLIANRLVINANVGRLCNAVFSM